MRIEKVRRRDGGRGKGAGEGGEEGVASAEVAEGEEGIPG